MHACWEEEKIYRRRKVNYFCDHIQRTWVNFRCSTSLQLCLHSVNGMQGALTKPPATPPAKVLILVLSNNGICITILPACVRAIVIVLSPPKTCQFLKSHQQGKNPWAHMWWSYICLHVVDGHWRNSSCTLGYSCTWWGDVKTLCKLKSGTHVLTEILFIYLCFFSCSKHRHEKSHLVTQNTSPPCTIS
jgi:hypothetical protein